MPGCYQTFLGRGAGRGYAPVVRRAGELRVRVQAALGDHEPLIIVSGEVDGVAVSRLRALLDGAVGLRETPKVVLDLSLATAVVRAGVDAVRAAAASAHHRGGELVVIDPLDLLQVGRGPEGAGG